MIGETRNRTPHFCSKNWGARLNVDFKNRLKSDLFLKIYIYSERGDFAASFYNKNSILMFFSKWSIFRGGGALITSLNIEILNSDIVFVR